MSFRYLKGTCAGLERNNVQAKGIEVADDGSYPAELEPHLNEVICSWASRCDCHTTVLDSRVSFKYPAIGNTIPFDQLILIKEISHLDFTVFDAVGTMNKIATDFQAVISSN